MNERVRFLERMTLVATEEGALDARYHRGRGGVPVLFVSDGDLDEPLLAELFWTVATAGHAALRFTPLGRGANKEIFVAAAIDHLRETEGDEVVVIALGAAARLPILDDLRCFRITEALQKGAMDRAELEEMREGIVRWLAALSSRC